MLAKLPANQAALLEAADLIELNGHCKFMRNRKGAFCVLGAISQAATGNAWLLMSSDGPCAVFRAYIGREPAPWNNEKERTKEEVVAALRDAAFSQ